MNQTNTPTLEELAVRFRVTGLAYREALMCQERDFPRLDQLLEEAALAECELKAEIDRLIDRGAKLRPERR